jgi:hypothetical protein
MFHNNLSLKFFSNHLLSYGYSLGLPAWESWFYNQKKFVEGGS